MISSELSEQDRNWYILKGYEILTDARGNRAWYLNSICYREDGPAVEWADGGRAWRNEDGYLHREDGPAVDWASGTREWWLNGKYMTEEQHRRAVSEMKNVPAT